MGIYADLLAASLTIGPPPRYALDRVSAKVLQRQARKVDPPLATAYAQRNERWVVPEQTSAGVGDQYRLTFKTYGTLADIPAFSTALINYDDIDTVVQSAIDTACSAAIPGYLNSDLFVIMDSFEGLNTSDIIMENAGSALQYVPIMLSIEVIGWTFAGSLLRDQSGQVNRPAMQALFELNLIEGTLHGSGAPANYTRPSSNGQHRPSRWVIRDLAEVAAREDGRPETFDEIMSLYPLA